MDVTKAIFFNVQSLYKSKIIQNLILVLANDCLYSIAIIKLQSFILF